jgi:hypothetical protein
MVQGMQALLYPEVLIERFQNIFVSSTNGARISLAPS